MRPAIDRLATPGWVGFILGVAVAAAHADAAEVQTRSLRVGAQHRSYMAEVPAASRPMPLVLVLHGNTQQGADMRARTGWSALSARERFAVVFPDGLNRAWADLRSRDERAGASAPAGTDDVAFLLALVEHFVEAGIADPSRVYVAGASNGGAMATTMACGHPQTFAAAASMIMSLTTTMAEACKPVASVPMLWMLGTADPLVAYGGGRGEARRAVSGLLSASDTMAFWRRINRCEPGDAHAVELPDRDTEDRSTVTRIASRCPAGADVMLYRVNGGGHRLPGHAPDARMNRLVERLLGLQNRDIDAAEEVWAFFARHRRP